VTNSAYTTVFGTGPPPPGSGTNLGIVPVFAGTESYQLTSADSALLDAGDPAQVMPGETDLAGQPRVLAAACNGARDIGAYELPRANSCPSHSPGGVKQASQPTGTVTPAATGHKAAARPTISGLRVKKRRQGAALEFRLSEPATITVTISKAIRHGQGKGKKTSYVSVGKFTADASGGGSVIALTPRLDTVGGTPGVYRLTVIATANGLSSEKHTVSAFKSAAD
jgi:hypothetical protein